MTGRSRTTRVGIARVTHREASALTRLPPVSEPDVIDRCDNRARRGNQQGDHGSRLLSEHVARTAAVGHCADVSTAIRSFGDIRAVLPPPRAAARAAHL